MTRRTHSRPRSFFTKLHFYPFEQLSNCCSCKPPESWNGGDPEVVVSPSVRCRRLELVGRSLLRVFFHASTQTRAGALRTSTRTSSRTTTRFQQRQTHVMSQFHTAYAAYRPHQAVQLCWQTLQSAIYANSAWTHAMRPMRKLVP